MKRNLLKTVIVALVFFAITLESKAQLSANFTYTAGCAGSPTYFFDASSGLGIWQWQWNFGDGSTSTQQNPVYTYGTGGTYSVRLVVSDSTLMTNDTIFISVVVPSGPSITFNITDGYCGGNGSIDAVISGGSLPYSYSWSTGSSLQDVNFIPAGTYGITVVDAVGCISAATATVGSQGIGAPSVSGAVLNSTGNPINGGTIEFIQKFTGIVRGSASVSGGYYTLPSLTPIGQYLVKVTPDTTLHPYAIPTYLGTTPLWGQSTVVQTQCDSNFVINVEVIDLTPLAGSSTVQGLIVVDTTGTAQFKTGAAGDPIPGVDVSLEQVPGGIIAHTQTGDGTNGTTLGVFSFENVPVSANPYKILVDIPGSNQLQEQTVTVSAEGSNITNVNYAWTDAGVVIASGTYVKEWKQNGTTEAYPIPFSNELTITYSVKEASDVKIELTDVLGKSTVLLNQQQVSNGNYLFKYDSSDAVLSSGVYFVKISIADYSEVLRVIKE